MTGAHLSQIDAIILVLYLLVTLYAGSVFSSKGRTAKGYLLGGRTAPWWLLLGSIVATETSAVTFLSLPGKSFGGGGDCQILQLTLGYILGRILLIRILLPEFFRGNFFTAYEVLQKRYGLVVRRLASCLFLLARNISDGLRLFLAALLLQAATGVDMTICVVVVAAVTGIYSLIGGVTAVVYNDAAQFVVYNLGGILVLGFLISEIPDGMTGILAFAADTGRNQVFDFSFSLTTPRVTFWSGLIGGAFLTFATHGADQMMVQRYLCARSKGEASLALGLSGPVVLLQFAMFLLIGIALACFYDAYPLEILPKSNDKALLTYLVHGIPVGLRGLLLASVLAVVMSTLSSSLNSSASVVVNDLVQMTGGASDERTVLAAKAWTLFFAGVQAAVAIGAYWMSLEQQVIDVVLQIAGFSTGLLLGLYILGMVVGQATALTGVLALLGGLILICGVAFGTSLSWPWYSLVGVVSTFLLGLVLTFVLPHQATK